jgi:hypothetical protein
MGQVPYGLLDELGTKTAEFRFRDWSSLLQTVELLYLVGGAEPDNTSKLIASLLRLLGVPFGHPTALRDQVHKHGKEREYDQPYDPECFPQPEISWCRNRSMNTVMSSQIVTTNTNIVKASTRKLRNVKPSSTNSIAILHVSDAQRLIAQFSGAEHYYPGPSIWSWVEKEGRAGPDVLNEPVPFASQGAMAGQSLEAARQ